MPDEPSKPPPQQAQTYAQAAAEGTDNPPPYGQTENSISVTGISNGKGDGDAAAGPSGGAGAGAGPSSTHVNAVQAPPPAPAAFTHPAARPHHPHPHARAHNHAHGHLGRHRDVEAGVVLFIPEREIALSRARRRFFGALCWALVIYLVLASITGSTIHDVSRRGRHGHWDKRGVWHASSAMESGTTVV
ncbi:uncharacterized protein LOC62_07G009712 [Vanrija pseudolonga]|uniref:Uncharacterized protein n=1 Tax=Vanrija pseudolonga TaxID=143232 RepID=A0AAF0YGZ2_9TREE|nr:hypothetical protein LOC62_07G009712 [Vanrija pseudolonga]